MTTEPTPSARELAKLLAAVPDEPTNGDGHADTPTPGPVSDEPGGLTLEPNNPRPSARAFIATHHRHGFGATLVCSGDVFYSWDGTRYVELPAAGVRSAVGAFLERAKRRATRGKGDAAKPVLVPFKPTAAAVSNVLDALSSIAYTPAVPPCWLADDGTRAPAANILATPDGLLHLTRTGDAVLCGPPTPAFFSLNATDYRYEPDAPEPARWLRFLDELWPDDGECIQTLQQWFGYTLTCDGAMQKGLLICGPKRSGKSTIGRVLAGVVGPANVAAPSLAGLATNFGLWSLVGKQLGVIADGRLSGRSDLSIVQERLLNIIGQDAVCVDRKNLPPLTMTLPTRLMLLTNELPRWGDTSGALPSRFIVLTLQESFFGREDTGLGDALLAERAGILNWSLAGLRTLRAAGRFTQPASSAAAVEQMEELSSPVAAFLRSDLVAVGPGHAAETGELFDAYRAWLFEQGAGKMPTAATFGRDLRTVMPGIGFRQPRADDGSRGREYVGVSVTFTGTEAAARWRARHEQARVPD